MGALKLHCDYSFLRILIFSCVLISTPIDCDIIYSGQESVPISSSESSLIGKVLRNYNSPKSTVTNGSVEYREKCHQDVETVLNAFAEGEFWALRIADASGKISSGFVWGSNFFLGSKPACDSINFQNESLGLSSKVKSLHSILAHRSPVAVAYQVFVANFTSDHQIDVEFNVRPLIHLGLCLPRSCDPVGFYAAVQEAFESVDVYSIQNVIVQYHKEGLDKKWAVLEVPEFYILLMIAGFSVGISVIYSFFWMEKKKALDSSRNTDCEGGTDKKGESPNMMENFCKCFSLEENKKKLFNTSTPPKEIRSINGIRSIACLWIICLHTNIYSRLANGSFPELQFLMAHPGFLMRFLMYGFVSVDSFFVISGFLLVFNFLNNDKLRKELQELHWMGNVKKYMRYVLNRYLRLTPLVIVIMIIIGMMSKYLDKSSIFDIRTNIPDLQCTSQSILINLIYGQNFGNSLLISCGSWLWYLANDMQYYVIFLALLFVYTKHPVIAKTIFALVTLAVLGATFCISYLNGFQFQADVIYRTYHLLYTAPHVRVVPFQAGMLIGYLGHWMKKRSIKMNLFLVRTAWVLAIGYLLGPIVLNSNVDSLSSLICSLGYSVGKFFYGSAVGGLILLNIFAPDSIVQRVLSHGFFVHLNKLCYSMYLIHPLVVILLFGLRSQPIYLSESIMLTYSMSVAVISYLVALGMNVLVEMPFVKLANLI